MPLVKDPPPRRRLGKSNGDHIIALFEGSSTKESANNNNATGDSSTSKNKSVSSKKDENEQIISSLFPSKGTNTGNNTDQEVGDDGGDHPSFDENAASPTTTTVAPLPAPRTARSSSPLANLSQLRSTSATATSGSKSNLKKKDTAHQTVSTEVQTTAGGAEFRIYELVLTSAPNSSGVVTREHAAHRAMLERQISQRIVDARLDERFTRQAIEEASDVAMAAVGSAFKFHAQAMHDFLYLKEETRHGSSNNNDDADDDEDVNEDDSPETVQRKMIAQMNSKLTLAAAGEYKNAKKVPRFIPSEKYQRVLDENVALLDRVDLVERRLQAQSQGIPYLVNTIRFPAPPPSLEVLNVEEEKVRGRLLSLEDELITNLVSIWGTPPAHLVRQYRAARQQQQQAVLSLTLEQKIQQTVVEVEAKERGDLEDDERKAFCSEVRNEIATEFFTSVVSRLNAEKEMYRLRCALLVVEASEESSRLALTETVLDVRQSLLETFYDETKIKSDLTRKLRGSLQDQHNQAMRHKKEMAKQLPPVADRIPPRNSSIKITPEARRAAALVLTEQKNPSQTQQQQQQKSVNNTPQTARSLANDLLPAIHDKKQTPASLTPRPPQQQQQGDLKEASLSKRTLGGFASSYAKSSLYNSGFSRSYENL